ncbi:MAG: hypothetical protein ABJD11_03895, partial [Gemmatimonadota bacterium]
MILRCYNPTDSAVEGAWRTTKPIRRAILTRADEIEGQRLDTREVDSLIPFIARKGELVTIRFD